MKKPRDVIQPRWRVFRLRKRAERMPFTVTAKNAEEAIERAIEEFEIPESRSAPGSACSGRL